MTEYVLCVLCVLCMFCVCTVFMHININMSYTYCDTIYLKYVQSVDYK